MIYQFDVLIIGCGVAGLATAIKCAERGLSVGIISKAHDPNVTNTFHAQGGIIFPQKNDADLVDDIDRASSFTANLDAARVLQDKGEEIVRELLLEKAKTAFERNEKGELKFTREAAHSQDRILYRGDFTGQEIQQSLMNYLKSPTRFPNVTFITEHTAIDLLTPIHHGIHMRQRYEPARVVGAYLYNQSKQIVFKALARVTVLATGGVGTLYLHHSNSDAARGDGHAMAKRAGAVVTNMEYIQFHPTTYFDSSSHRRFLISEALRGEGGILLNSEGKAFMDRYHPDRELAPRDIVSRAIVHEMIKTRHECVYIDISHKKGEWIKQRFPTIYSHCMEKRLDITQTPIPVVPAAHYTCGGVKTDLFGRSNLPGLYAVGEVACTGLHGANRLASTSLVEGLTFGSIAADNIFNSLNDFPAYNPDNIKDWENGKEESDEALIQQDYMTLRTTMWNYVGLIRTSNRLGRAEAMFGQLYQEVQKFYRGARLKDSLIGLRNAIEVALMVVHASRINRNSAGCFFRKD